MIILKNNNWIKVQFFLKRSFVISSIKTVVLVAEDPKQITTPCNPSPCGANTNCKEKSGAASCTCFQDYYGDPYVQCRPECVTSSDCPHTKDCYNNKCRDPCPGACGLYSECSVINHSPTCYCSEGYTGNPLTKCYPIMKDQISPCAQTPCGPYSNCKESNGHAICSCLPQYIGSPPACRPECMVNSECPPQKACFNKKCVDPCIDNCGINAECRVINHNAICSCQNNQIGDPFVRCIVEPSKHSFGSILHKGSFFN